MLMVLSTDRSYKGTAECRLVNSYGARDSGRTRRRLGYLQLAPACTYDTYELELGDV